MSYVVIIPSIYQPYTDACLLSCNMENIFVVDNTEINRGVPASWNLGIKEMYEADADWLFICSAAVRFGESGGLDVAEQLSKFTNDPDAPFVEGNAGQGWHAIGVSRWIIDAIGTFDENFFPGYCEDNDMAYRSFLHRGHWGWPRVNMDLAVVSNAHGLKLGGVKPTSTRSSVEYYERKWGGYPSHEIYTHPFNDHKLPLSYWEPRND